MRGIGRSIEVFLWTLLWGSLVFSACARLPYTTQVIHQDTGVVVALQRDMDTTGYSHPVHLRPDEVTAILSGYSFRAKQRLPLRWFAEEAAPRKIFRSDELQTLAPALAEALQKAAPHERVHFQVLAPGMNPANEQDVTGGWVMVRDQYFHLTLEHFHAQFPVRSQEQWDLRYPAIPPQAGVYLLYFEPGRFWVTDPATHNQAVDFPGFLKSESGPSLK